MKRVPPSAKIVWLRVPIVYPALYYLKPQIIHLFVSAVLMELIGTRYLHSVHHAHHNVSCAHLTTSPAAVLYVQPVHHVKITHRCVTTVRLGSIGVSRSISV